MLRFLALTSLCLLIAFTGIGLLICKAWGWPEYASAALYLIYSQGPNNSPQFFIINTDGSGQGEKLTWNGSNITSVDCSWDGRVLAFMTGDQRLHVITNTETIMDLWTYDLSLASVANDGTVALYSWLSGTVLVRGNEVKSFVFPLSSPMVGSAQITSAGLALWWGQEFMERIFVDAQGNVGMYHNGVGGAQWLASEQMFTYTPYVDSPEPEPVVLVDAATQRELPIALDDFGLLSPDATQLVSLHTRSLNNIDIVGALRRDPSSRQLVHSDVPSSPVCFLTFRPQMLIADTQ